MGADGAKSGGRNIPSRSGSPAATSVRSARAARPTRLLKNPSRARPGGGMERTRAWLAARGFELRLQKCARDHVDFGAKVVVLNSLCCYQTRLATLLHECGHVGVHLQRLRRPRERLAGFSLLEDLTGGGRCDERGRASRLSVLQEELVAWDNGAKLALRLGVTYAKGRFERLRTAALMTYVDWTAARMRKTKKRRSGTRRSRAKAAGKRA
jgi:hypothetical protein